MPDVWIDINISNSQAKERTGYPTQKPLALLESIITASSQVGDMVFDLFCGCTTTCIAAEKLGRQWIGIDISSKAAELVQSRMRKEIGLFFQGSHRLDLPQRTDLGKELHMNTQPPTPQPKRPRGHPIVRVIEPIDAGPEEIVRAVFRVADRERDTRLNEDP